MTRFAFLLAIPVLFLSFACATAGPSPVGSSLFSEQLSHINQHIAAYERIVQSGGWQALPKGKKLEPGMQHARVVMLRDILQKTGDYKGDAVAAAADVYDAEMVAAVLNFQTRHGLKADGIVGPSTLAALNVPATDRLAALHVTAEKLRTFILSQSNQTESIVVNIPSYTLYALEGEKVADSMKVIVGRPDRKTPLLHNEITYLQFNPAWYVPSRIAATDLLPKIKHNPNFLRNSGFTLSQNGERVDPQDIDWSAYGKGNFPFSLTQKPGSSNALGKIKFHMPDSNAIYLHDTATPALFAAEERALSSGCMRLENPLALAQFVLKHGNDMNAEEAAALYHRDQPERVSLKRPIPVHVVYWTAWVDTTTDQPYFYKDVYKRDAALIASKKQELNHIKVAASGIEKAM